MTSFWKKVQEVNLGVFPVLVLAFLGFAVTEELRPGFFTFYISQWVIILPVIISGAIFACSEIEHEQEEKWPVWAKWMGLVVFQILFVIGFWWRVEIESSRVFWSFFGVSGVLFGVFQWALIFSEQDQCRQIVFLQKTGRIIRPYILPTVLMVILGVMVFFFVWWLRDPYFWEV